MKYNSKSVLKMKKLVMSIIFPLAAVQAFAQTNATAADHSTAGEPATRLPIGEIILPILFMSFLVIMLITLIKYFLDYRLKNKLIERGMAEQLSAYSAGKNDAEKKNEAVKLAIIFCGLGTGLIITYLTAPVHLHSLAIMAFSIGLSYLAYFFYLRR
jgi:hypothetical protein